MKSELLKLLCRNARYTNEELAIMLDSDEKTIAKTIEKLEKEGIIRGYKAVIDWDSLDDAYVSAIVELNVVPKADLGFEEVAEKVMSYHDVESVYLMSGSYDLSVTVKGNDLKSIALFVSQRLATIEGVLSTATHFVLKTYKDKGIFIEDEEEKDERSMIAP